MKSVYRLYSRNCVFCSFHVATGKRESLHTRDEREAKTLLAAKLEAERQPVLNLKLARVYLAGSDPQAATRTWGDVLVQFLAGFAPFFGNGAVDSQQGTADGPACIRVPTAIEHGFQPGTVISIVL